MTAGPRVPPAAAARDAVIAGAGPAGLMLGLLLARAGLRVTVLERHADFLRDFRGDTVHASTQRSLDELGLGERFRALPGGRLGNLVLPVHGGGEVLAAAFDRLRQPYDHVAMVPQWDLLRLLADAAAEEPGFELRLRTEAVGLVSEAGRVTGLRIRDEEGEGAIPAALVIACDGRGSVLREAAGLVPVEHPVPFDVWWFRLPRPAAEREALGSIAPRFAGRDLLIELTRPEHLQLGLISTPGQDDELRRAGIAAFRRRVAAIRPGLEEGLAGLAGMEQVHHLRVRLNRLRRWHRPGLLLLGDAAHAMSPVGGIGVNLAVQDAIAAARALARPLQRAAAGRPVPTRALRAVQRRRALPMRVLQFGQRRAHDLVFSPLLAGRATGIPRVLAALLRALPPLRRIAAFVIAEGLRREPVPGFARRPQAPVAAPDRG